MRSAPGIQVLSKFVEENYSSQLLGGARKFRIKVNMIIKFCGENGKIVYGYKVNCNF